MTPEESSTPIPETPIGNFCAVEAPRWRVRLPFGTLKGISRSDCYQLARQYGGAIDRSWVRLYSNGTEELGPWTNVETL